jgi:heme-degrading monooxygenase HmoA
MHARVTTLWLPPSRLDAAVRFFREEVAPAMTSQPGVQAVWLLVDQPAGKQLAIGLWETLADLEATGFLYQELRAKVGELYGGPPIGELYEARPPEQAIYEVRAQPARPEGQAAARVARVTTARGAPERVEDIFRQFQAQMAPVLERLPGYQGVYLLVDSTTGTVVSVALWASAEALTASEAAVGRMRAQAAQTLGPRAAPAVELYEVAVHP